MGVGRGPGDVTLSPYCPTTKWGLGERPQGQHGPTVIVAGFPNRNHLSAQIPRVLRKQERESRVLERGNAGLWDRFSFGGAGTQKSQQPSSQSESIRGHSFIDLRWMSDAGPRLSPDLALSLTCNPEPTPTLTLNPGHRLTLSLIPD